VYVVFLPYKILRSASSLPKPSPLLLAWLACTLHLEPLCVITGEPEQQEESFVADVAFTVATLAFFVVAILYLRGCERLQ
jgi:hypothetical protein